MTTITTTEQSTFDLFKAVKQIIKQHYGSLALHGHCHSSYQGQGKILDVGIDNAYKLYGEHRLFSEQDVIDFMKERPTHIADAHRTEK